jgi:hypothetical protein
MAIKPSLPSITINDFAQLTAAEQIDVLRCLDARQKTALLLDSPHGAELMAQLHTQEVYLLAVERGPEHLPELLSLATPEQWSGFIDLDCWEGDQFNSDKTHCWLISLLQGEEENVFDVLQQMNFELLVLIFKSEMDIISGPEADEKSDARIDAKKRDGGYEISYYSENSAKLFEKLLDVLQSFSPEFFVYLMEAVRSETMGLIVESVYQQRTGRLLDMGIPEPFSAQKIYAWLDPEVYREDRPVKLAPGTSEISAPGFTMTLARPKGLLADVLADGIDEGLAWEMANVVNKVILADRIDMGNVEQVSNVVAKVDAYLNLGLEWLAGTDVDEARTCMSDCSCEDLFRLGFSLTLRLKRRGDIVGNSSVAPYLDHNARACLSALHKFPPLFFEGVADLTQGGTRLFASLDEIGMVEHWLVRMELQRQLFEDVLHFPMPDPKVIDLSGCQPDNVDDITLVEFFLTSLANKLLGRDFQPLPIAEEELAGLHGMVSQSGVLNPRLREETVKWLDSLMDGGDNFATYCLDVWEEEFCSIGFEDIDPRFIGGMIVQLEDI